MLGTGLGHTVLVTSWRYTIHWLHWCGWLSRTKYSSGWSHWPHYTSPGDTGGAWSLHWSLHSGSPGGRMTWATWVSVSLDCVSRLHTTGQSPVCHCMSVCHRVPGPARTILHTRLTRAADTGLRLRLRSEHGLTDSRRRYNCPHCTGLGQGPPTLESSQPRPLSLGERLSLSRNLSRDLGLEAGGGSRPGIGPWCFYFRPWKLTLLTHTKT